MLFQIFIVSEQAHENPLKKQKDSKQEVNQKCKMGVKLRFDCDIISTRLCISDELFMSANASLCFYVHSKADAWLHTTFTNWIDVEQPQLAV